MRFYVNELNIDLFLPLTILSHEQPVGNLVSSQHINNFINGNSNLYSIIFKQLNEFECKQSTIMKDWINHIITYKVTSNKYTILNENEISQDLVNLYRNELILREPKIPKLQIQLKDLLHLYNRSLFVTGDILQYTTKISYKDASVPSKLYLHQIIIY
jgi:hypothetical protein